MDRVVLVVHGIRDLGYWSDDLRNEIDALAGSERVEVKPPGYGWYSMGQFLLWPSRQANVRRFMNDYTDVVARYPKARISFIGHSNGTYILAGALQKYVSLEFDRVVLAGSVIPSNFEWARYADAPANNVGGVRNVVAGDDLVVAVFPYLFEQLRGLPFLHNSKSLDIGAAGFLGFQRESRGRYESVKFLQGGHSAFLDAPERIRAVAAYILTGDDKPLRELPHLTGPVGWISVASRLCSLVWLLLFVTVGAMGFLVVRFARRRRLAWLGGLAFAALVLLLLHHRVTVKRQPPRSTGATTPRAVPARTPGVRRPSRHVGRARPGTSKSSRSMERLSCITVRMRSSQACCSGVNAWPAVTRSKAAATRSAEFSRGDSSCAACFTIEMMSTSAFLCCSSCARWRFSTVKRWGPRPASAAAR